MTIFARSSVRPASLMGLCVALMLLLASTGCEAGRFAAYVVGGDGERQVHVKAQYRGLENKRFAVLVAADEYTLFTYPGATQAISREMAARIATNVPGSVPMNPQEVAQFQKNNPYWITVPYGQLLERLKVDRLVVVDLVEYSLREPGNAHIWQGQIIANVGVAEAESPDGNRLAFNMTVKARHPDDSGRVGVLNSDDHTIQLGLLATFSTQAVWLFHDHEEVIQ